MTSQVQGQNRRSTQWFRNMRERDWEQAHLWHSSDWDPVSELKWRSQAVDMDWGPRSGCPGQIRPIGALKTLKNLTFLKCLLENLIASHCDKLEVPCRAERRMMLPILRMSVRSSWRVNASFQMEHLWGKLREYYNIAIVGGMKPTETYDFIMEFMPSLIKTSGYTRGTWLREEDKYIS